MPKSRRQGRGRRWRGPLSQHRPRHVRRLQVGNLVAPHLHRARGRERRRFQPGPPLALLDLPRNARSQNSSGCRNGLACQTFASGRARARSPALTRHVLPRCRLLQSSSILIPGDTVWRRCKAGRLAILNDAAAYFAALREALLLATRQVYIIGWDIHSLTRFVGPSGQADDGYPAELGAFLKALLKAKPGLRINILSWNFPALYAAEREWNSAAKFTSEASDRLCFCFDSSLPLGSAQHQKIVVIDGALAFVGGLDLTIRRWDTSAHDAHHPLRDRSRRQAVSAVSRRAVHGGWRSSGQPDGSGGAQMARCRLHGRNIRGVTAERWPASVPVQSRGMTVGIARTEIATASEAGVTRSRGCSRPPSRRPTASSISRTSSPASSTSRACWRSGCWTCHSFGSHRHAEDAFVLVRIAGHAERPRRIYRTIRGGRRDGPGSLSPSRDRGCGSRPQPSWCTAR